MKSWRTWFIICLVLLITSNVFWLSVLIDSSISHSYLEASYKDSEHARAVLGRLIAQGWNAYSKKDLLHILRQSKPDAFIVEEPDAIIFEHIRFKFEDGRLASVG